MLFCGSVIPSQVSALEAWTPEAAVHDGRNNNVVEKLPSAK